MAHILLLGGRGLHNPQCATTNSKECSNEIYQKISERRGIDAGGNSERCRISRPHSLGR